MAITHNWDTPGLLHTRYQGLVTGRQMVSSALEVSGSEEFDDLKGIIGDWSGVEDMQVSHRDIEELVAYITAMNLSNPRIKNANIAKQGSAENFFDFYKELSQQLDWQMAYFTTFEDATEWLEL